MTEEQIQSTSPTSEFTQEYLEGSSTLTDDSEINEEFHRIRAIERDGLPVEITGVVPDLTYVQNIAYNSKGGSVKTKTGLETEEITDEFLTIHTDRPVFFFSTAFNVDFNIYYSTPFGQTYELSFPESPQWSRSRYRSENVKPILRHILRTVDSSDGMNTISDISPLNTIDATIHPDKSITDGEISVGGETAQFSHCRKVDVNKRGWDRSDSITRFVTGDGYRTVNESDDRLPNEWIWSYISDLRFNDDTIVVTVNTPIGKAAFPYTLDHDTDSPLWDLVDHSGGQLTSLRGMDVCIRTRGEYPRIYEEFDIRSSGFNSHDYPEFGKTRTGQPLKIETDEEDISNNEPVVIQDPTNVQSVGTDVNFAWTLGIPENDRFPKDSLDDGDDSKSDEQSTEDKTVISKLSSFL